MVPGYKKYKSKVDSWLVILMLLSFGGGAYVLIENWDWTGGLIHIAIFILVLYFLYSISYEINGEDLLINYAAFYQKKIAIASIKHVKETRNPLGSPAASLDRLEIKYGNHGVILISPKDKTGFIAHIKSLVPEVKVVLRDK